MSSNFKLQSSKLSRRDLKISTALLLFIFHFSLFTFSACIPNLEKPECTAAREAVRNFYSYHFAGDMKQTAENLKQREKFLSADLTKNLAAQNENATDYFTQTSDYPKAFRVGGCTIDEPNERVDFGVLLFWKTDTRSEQKEIHVEAVNENGKWLINKVAN